MNILFKQNVSHNGVDYKKGSIHEIDAEQFGEAALEKLYKAKLIDEAPEQEKAPDPVDQPKAPEVEPKVPSDDESSNDAENQEDQEMSNEEAQDLVDSGEASIPEEAIVEPEAVQEEAQAQPVEAPQGKGKKKGKK